ncbi:GNAT family N-acetyltransferase [Halocatena pleomorpha]|uniref:N-acetyltransferase n=1 Tax=Halocatena pleomorpha TaxID=1785090 RepID=A0A3P3R7X8_9EURY|nr:GNAT family N-acetyltransferase [Halocatena pleomorpha]RRJ29039.1 N-acetyltransferase [Halocatena pleomorpha]
MEYEVLGWPSAGPTLRLDHREFAYAGKFVMSNTGKAIVRDSAAGSDIVGAVAFNEDRTAPDTVWFRYITTRKERRGEGIGARLAAYTTARAHDRGYDRVVIAVNNPFAYHALSKAGFGFTGERTGIAELVLEHPSDRARYREGLAVFRERDLTEAEQAFLDAKADAGPPPVVTLPD